MLSTGQFKLMKFHCGHTMHDRKVIGDFSHSHTFYEIHNSEFNSIQIIEYYSNVHFQVVKIPTANAITICLHTYKYS